MATKLTDTQTLSGGSLTTGVKNPTTLTKFPEGGATFQVSAAGSLSASPAIVQLRGWVNGVSTPEILATFTIPVPTGSKINDMYDSQPVFSIWDDWDWNVTQVGASTTSIVLGCVGVGV
jgi:hypothetical protein